MSLDTVVDDIRSQAREKAEAIRADGEERADEIRAAAREDAERIREDAAAAVEQQVQQEREQATSAAKLEAKQERLAARRELLDEVRAEMEQAVADLSGDRRHELTDALLADATASFGDDDVAVYCRASDQELVEQLADSYDGVSVAGEHDCLGGIVAESNTSRVRIDNTFDSIVEEAWENNLKAVSEVLFEDE